MVTDDPDALRVEFQMSLLLDPAMEASDWLLMQHHYPANCAHHLEDHRTLDWIRRSLADPNLKEPETFLAEAVERLTKRNMLENEAGRVRYVFDLSKPLNPQFDKAKHHLEAVQEELYGRQNTRKNHKDNWPLLLRALDANEAGATLSAMMRVFWPDQEKTPGSARDILTAAKRVRDNFPI